VECQIGTIAVGFFADARPGLEQPQMKMSQKVGLAAAVAAVGVTGGAIGASVIGTAGAASSTTSTAASTGGSTAPSHSTFPAHGSAAHEDSETPVTGSAATQARAAAVKAVGSGTAGTVTTDFTKDGYEVTVTKSDGTQVEVHLDSSFNVMMGHGGRSPDRDGGPIGG
jgi:hypothetical protein